MNTPASLEDEREYRDAVAHALGGFQLLEEGLKMHLNLYFDTVRDLIGTRLHFGFAGSEFQEAPLGRLVSIFSKVCPDQELLAQLRSVIKHRDKVAHQAFLCLYGNKPAKEELGAMAYENVKLGSTVADLMGRVHKETVRVLGVMEHAQKATVSKNAV
jgi:hypothetical protein